MNFINKFSTPHKKMNKDSPRDGFPKPTKNMIKTQIELAEHAINYLDTIKNFSSTNSQKDCERPNTNPQQSEDYLITSSNRDFKKKGIHDIPTNGHAWYDQAKAYQFGTSYYRHEKGHQVEVTEVARSYRPREDSDYLGIVGKHISIGYEGKAPIEWGYL